MNEHIERMARETGYVIGNDGPDCQFEVSFHRAQLETFARLIAEDCAALGDKLANNPMLEQYPFYQAQKAGTEMVSKAIRERYK